MHQPWKWTVTALFLWKIRWFLRTTVVVRVEQSFCRVCVWCVRRITVFWPRYLADSLSWHYPCRLRWLGRRSKFKVTGGKCLFFSYWCTLPGDLLRVNRQRATPNVHATLTVWKVRSLMGEETVVPVPVHVMPSQSFKILQKSKNQGE